MTDEFEIETGPSFPPLLSGLAVAGIDPFDKARAQAVLGVDAGLVVHNITPDQLRAAIVLAPEEPLESAMAAMIACAVGFQNALGALAPPEVAVHLTWDGLIKVNGAECGRLRAAASTTDADAVPDWLVIGLELQLIPVSEDDPGLTPDKTSLYQEGCGEVSPIRLLESWSRHSLVWLNTLEGNERAQLHEQWRGLVEEIGKNVEVNHNTAPLAGTFLGVDENFGMLLRKNGESIVIPLSSRLEGEKPT
ncbi:MAG: DUF4444 domain-containing protein [Paracoccaceae bacterium]|nr:DUF4444 domain-containing protein [Paracoccaceae bacterium]